jgi:hypothetical protein
MSFFSVSEIENKRTGHVLSRGLVSVGGWRMCGEGVGEYGANTVYTCM